jgi:hypothetical protein
MDRTAHRLFDQEVRRPARRYRTIEIQAGPQTLAAADPYPGTYAGRLNDLSDVRLQGSLDA